MSTESNQINSTVVSQSAGVIRGRAMNLHPLVGSRHPLKYPNFTSKGDLASIGGFMYRGTGFGAPTSDNTT